MPEKMPSQVKAVIGWVIGIGVIAFILLMMAIIFGNLSGNVGFSQDTSTVTNETLAFSDGGTIPTSASGKVNGNISSVTITNATGGETVTADNYTLSGVTVTADGTSTYNGSNVNISYTVSYDEQGKIDTDNIITNYTESATNTAEQLPTTGTIVGIAILLLILIALLVFAITKMMGVSGVSGKTGISSGNSFQGSSREFG